MSSNPILYNAAARAMSEEAARQAAASLYFSPAAVDALIERLTSMPSFPINRTQAMAMAFAFFATGQHNDNAHNTAKQWHKSYRAFRQDIPKDRQKTVVGQYRENFMKFMVDNATLWDRVFGGASVVLHSSGTRRPRTEPCPTEAAIQVYAEPGLLQEFPDLSYSLARLAQEFAEEFAPRAMTRWDTRTRKDQWGETGEPETPRIPPTYLIPESSSSLFEFFGRPYGSIENTIVSYGGQTKLVVIAPPADPPQAGTAVDTVPPAPIPDETSPLQPLSPPSSQSSRTAGKRKVVVSMEEKLENEWEAARELHPFSNLDLLDKLAILERELTGLRLANQSAHADVTRLQSENVSLMQELNRLGVEGIETTPTAASVRRGDIARASSPTSTSLSSVSSVSMSTAGLRAMVSSPAISAVGGRQNPGGAPTQRRHIVPFGPNTRRVFEAYGIAKSAHDVLWSVHEEDYEDNWGARLAAVFPDEGEAFITGIVNAMKADVTRG